MRNSSSFIASYSRPEASAIVCPPSSRLRRKVSPVHQIPGHPFLCFRRAEHRRLLRPRGFRRRKWRQLVVLGAAGERAAPECWRRSATSASPVPAPARRSASRNWRPQRGSGGRVQRSGRCRRVHANAITFPRFQRRREFMAVAVIQIQQAVADTHGLPSGATSQSRTQTCACGLSDATSSVTTGAPRISTRSSAQRRRSRGTRHLPPADRRADRARAHRNTIGPPDARC